MSTTLVFRSLNFIFSVFYFSDLFETLSFLIFRNTNKGLISILLVIKRPTIGCNFLLMKKIRIYCILQCFFPSLCLLLNLILKCQSFMSQIPYSLFFVLETPNQSKDHAYECNILNYLYQGWQFVSRVVFVSCLNRV